MIQVLASINEIGAATQRLQARGCGYHADPFKNWDLSLIADLVDPLDRTEPLLDVGCGESRCSVLNFLSRMGFSHLHGIDLRITLPDRLEQFIALRNRGGYRPPYHLHQREATEVGFKDATFGCVVCVSTIEHGVDLPRFFAEMSRVIKPGGALFLTTDYWPEHIDVGGQTAWGLPWRIFSRNDLLGVVDLAKGHGLTMEDAAVPDALDRPVCWGGADYTFVALRFRKRKT